MSSPKKVAANLLILQGTSKQLSSAPVWAEPSQSLFGTCLFPLLGGDRKIPFHPPARPNAQPCRCDYLENVRRASAWSLGGHVENPMPELSPANVSPILGF